MHYGGESVAGCHVNVGTGTYILNNLAEVDQIGGIKMLVGAAEPRAAESRDCVAGASPLNTLVIAVSRRICCGTLRSNRRRIPRCC